MFLKVAMKLHMDLDLHKQQFFFKVPSPNLHQQITMLFDWAYKLEQM